MYEVAFKAINILFNTRWKENASEYHYREYLISKIKQNPISSQWKRQKTKGGTLVWNVLISYV